MWHQAWSFISRHQSFLLLITGNCYETRVLQAGPIWRINVNDSISFINTWLPACSSTVVILDQMRNAEEASLSCSVPHVEVALNSRGNQLWSSLMGHQKTWVACRDLLSCTFSQSLSCTVLTGPTRNDLCAACRCASPKPSCVSCYSDDSIPKASLNQQRYSRWIDRQRETHTHTEICVRIFKLSLTLSRFFPEIRYSILGC